MNRHRLVAVLGTLLLVAGFALLLQPNTAQAQDAPVEPPFLAGFYNAWVGSGHADATAEAFVHWDAEGEVPADCARCHSTPGYQDYIGADGSEAWKTDAAVKPGTTVTCDACHNSVASNLTTVVFPSGVQIEDVGKSARCMACHQGRASTDSVNAGIEKLALADANTISADLRFSNIHYFAAAATLYGGEARGGYQYEGMAYQGKNPHVPGYDTCASCHSPHTLEVKVEECAACHEGVESVEDLSGIRMNGSLTDYDGDGDIDEGIADEIAGLQEQLLAVIQAYALEVGGTPIIYDAGRYPYFLGDINANGEIDGEEGAYPGYSANLLKAAYNYQVSMKDPGAFAHNPTYIIQLLADSITNLNAQLAAPVEVAQIGRTDPGHFDSTGEPFRHWDEEGEVPGSCARCHTAGGLPIYLKNGVNIASEPSNSLACTTCHANMGDTFDLYETKEIKFPSGAAVMFGEGEPSNLCLNCHQGRESTVSVNTAIKNAGVGDDEVSDKLSFRNVHYFAAGATLFGGDVKGAYQFEGMEYVGRNMHAGDDGMQMCTDCHDEHQLTVKFEDCTDCHEDVEEPEDVLAIRVEPEDGAAIDFDGDGDAAEPIKGEVDSLEEALWVAIQKYASEKAGVAIAYNTAAYPYFFLDANANGVVDPEETERYATWTPNLLRAAYNYQYVQKDPGVFAHNPDYAIQILVDSIAAVGGDVSAYTRPEVVAAS